MTQKPSFDAVGESNPEKPSVAEQTRTRNEAGGVAFDTVTPEFGLYKVVLNNVLEDSYYDSVEESFDKVWNAFDRCADENPEFVLQLAAYARQEEGFRDIPQLLLVLAANDERVVRPDDETVSWVRDYTPAIIDRTDEFNSVLSYQLRGYGTPVPNGLKKGIEDALHKKYIIVGGHNTEDATRYTFIEGVTSPPTDGDFGTGVGVLDEGYVHDEYTFTKYAERDKEVSLHDVLNLVRPTPRSDNRNQLFASIAKGELSEGQAEKDHWDVDGNYHPSEVEPLREDRTWESTMSDDEDDRSEAEKWRDRIDDMGIMARVRNLRNMREAGLSGEEIFDYDIGDGGYGEFGEKSAEIVRNSKQFPFRYYQAYKACGDVGVERSSGFGRAGTKEFTIGRGSLLDEFSQEWLDGAIDTATENLPDTLENTFTAIDLSGSMDKSVSNHSDMARAEIASLFGAMLMKRDSDTGAFGDDFATIEANQHSREAMSTLEMAKRIYAVSDEVGNSTNAHKALEWATDADESYDRFVFFTDEQVWDSTWRSDRSLKSAWDEYTAQVNENATLYICDLASYGYPQFPESYDSVVQIQGWSSSIIEYIDKYEDTDIAVDDIKGVSPEDY